jgi:hypothetical protein
MRKQITLLVEKILSGKTIASKGMTYGKSHQIVDIYGDAVRCNCTKPHSWHPIRKDGSVAWYKATVRPAGYNPHPKKRGKK